jgi:probable F420-dependent oxidoreductase
VKLGLGLGGGVEEIAGSAQLAEAAGFESGWVAELEHSAFVQAAAVAAATDRLAIGTAVALAFPRSPTITAMEAADLAALSGGRFLLGLGSQVRRIIEARFGVAYDRPAARLEDYVGAVRAVWAARRGESTGHDGPFYRISMPTFTDRHLDHRSTNPMTDPGGSGAAEPPILVAAVGPLMSRTAGRVADGVIGHPFASPAWLRETVAPSVARGLEEAGRPPEACPISAMPLVAIAPDADAARRAAKLQLAFYATTPNYSGILRLHRREEVMGEVRRAFVRGDRERMIRAIDDELLDTIAIAGPPDEARHRLAAWDGIADRAILALPFYGVEAGFGRELWLAIVETFGVPDARHR